LRVQLGLTQILYEINLGRQLPYHLQLNNLRMIHEYVMPHVTQDAFGAAGSALPPT
jgi:hypothetical protein